MDMRSAATPYLGFVRASYQMYRELTRRFVGAILS
jgi:hypothetical protein